MKKFIFVSRSTDDNKFNLLGGEGYKNLGPFTDTKANDGELSVKLVKEVVVPEDFGVVGNELAFEATGDYVVQIDGELIPQYVAAENLDKFLTGKGLSIEPDTEVRFTRISTGKHEYRATGPTVSKSSIEPTWDWDNLTPEQIADLADRRDLIVHKAQAIEADTFVQWTHMGTAFVDVRVVGPGAFANLRLRNVTLGDGVVRVEVGAFAGNDESNSVLELNDRLSEVQAQGFAGWTGCKRLIIRNALKTIGVAAFAGWTSCERLYINTTGTLGDLDAPHEMFQGMGSKPGNKLMIRALGITAFGNSVFANLGNVSSLTITTSAKIIAANAFFGLGMSYKNNPLVPPMDFQFGSGMTLIGDSALMMANIKNIRISSSPELVIGPSAFFNSEIESLTIVEAKMIETMAFAQCTKLKEIIFIGGVETMMGSSFQAVPVKEVFIPDGCKYVYGGVFAACTELEKIEIAEGLLEVGSPDSPHGFFSGTTGPIKKLIYPNSLTKFYGDDLAPLSSLEDVYFGNNLEVFRNVNISAQAVNVYLFTPFKEGFDIPYLSTPMCCLFVEDLVGYYDNTNQIWIRDSLAYAKIPFEAGIPPLPILEPVMPNPNDWSIQYRLLSTGEQVTVKLGEEIKLGDIDTGLHIDEVIISPSVMTILPDALKNVSIKRLLILDGPENLCATIGGFRLRDAVIPDSVIRIGSPIFNPLSLRKVIMPTQYLRSVMVEQFNNWPPHIRTPLDNAEWSYISNPSFFNDKMTCYISESDNVKLFKVSETDPQEFDAEPANGQSTVTVNYPAGTFAVGDKWKITNTDIVLNVVTKEGTVTVIAT